MFALSPHSKTINSLYLLSCLKAVPEYMLRSDLLGLEDSRWFWEMN